ncbi:hypothetical protein SDJN02_22007, partial [Cucurbita argyrosperma subsp. argyrosperma]
MSILPETTHEKTLSDAWDYTGKPAIKAKTGCNSFNHLHHNSKSPAAKMFTGALTNSMHSGGQQAAGNSPHSTILNGTRTGGLKNRAFRGSPIGLRNWSVAYDNRAVFVAAWRKRGWNLPSIPGVVTIGRVDGAGKKKAESLAAARFSFWIGSIKDEEIGWMVVTSGFINPKSIEEPYIDEHWKIISNSGALPHAFLVASILVYRLDHTTNFIANSINDLKEAHKG